MKKQIFFAAMVLLIFAGCQKENELKKSILIYDPENIELPAYSEWGYNTFGAYYDREIFISNNDVVPAKVVVSDTLMSFVLDGQIHEPGHYFDNEYYYYQDNAGEMKIAFNLSGFSPENYSNLTLLNDTSLDLKNPLYKVIISIDTLKYPAEIISGELKFKRAQNLLVDKEQVEVILSGYFEFKAFVNAEAITISSGRFDVGISPDNFYKQ